jgi:undecaprenyl-diphosphatase
MNNLKQRWWILFIFLLIPACILSVAAHYAAFFPWDLYLTQYIQLQSSPGVTRILEVISFLFGSWRAALLVVLAALLVWCRLGRVPGIAVLLSGVLSTIDYLLKIAVRRPRPGADLVQVMVSETGWSFPSGHTFTAVLFLGFLMYLVATGSRKGLRRGVMLFILPLLVLLVGFSRVYLGVHWTSDVLGGLLWGSWFLALVIYAYRRWQGPRPRDASSLAGARSSSMTRGRV